MWRGRWLELVCSLCDRCWFADEDRENMGNMQEGGGWHAWRRRGDVGGGCATVGCD